MRNQVANSANRVSTPSTSVTRFPGGAAFLAAALAAMLLAGGARAGEGDRVSEIAFTTPGPVPLLSPVWGLADRATIVVSDDSLMPRRIVVEAGQTVSWVSAARDRTRITFEREVARHMVCDSVVNFHLEDDELTSAPLATGDEASFCELAPGVYRYRVEREGRAGRALSNRLEGVIVVGRASGQD